MAAGTKLPSVVLLICLAVTPLEALLFPLLFPLSVKITIHSRPTSPPPVKSYHFEALPVYREVSVKGSTHISSPHHTYGSGLKYGTSYDGGHTKVYTGEPHVVGSKVIRGLFPGLPSIDGHISITSNPSPPKSGFISITTNTEPHYKGTPYSPAHHKGANGHVHIKGTAYEDPPTTHYKGGDDPTHYKGTPYEDPPATHYEGGDDSSHYKGTPYDARPTTHYKGGDESTHYKGTPYDAPPATHYKGGDDSAHYKPTGHEAPPRTHVKVAVDVEPDPPYKGHAYDPPTKPKHVYKKHNYIKSVGGYKIKDYINDAKAPSYDDDNGYVAIPPGRTFAEMEEAHRLANSRKLGTGPKAYAAEEYADLGSHNKEYEHDPTYLDDTLPSYKRSVPKPRQRSRARVEPDFRYEASSSSYAKVSPSPREKRIYAGFGTSVYGDSYAKIVYVPRSMRVSIRRY